MEKVITCESLSEAFDYIEQNFSDGIIFTIEFAPEKTGNTEVEKL